MSLRAVAVVTFALAAATAACGGGAGTTAPSDVAATGACADPEYPAVQAGSHLIGDTQPPVPYSSLPPTSGWHASGPPPLGIHGEPLTEPEQVLALEAGAVVVTWQGLDEDARRALEDLAAEPPLAGRVAVTPYPRLDDGEVVLTTWGALQRCTGVDEQAIEAFVDAFAVDDPSGHG